MAENSQCNTPTTIFHFHNLFYSKDYLLYIDKGNTLTKKLLTPTVAKYIIANNRINNETNVFFYYKGTRKVRFTLFARSHFYSIAFTCKTIRFCRT